MNRRVAGLLAVLLAAALCAGAQAEDCPFAGYQTKKTTTRAVADGVQYTTYALAPLDGPAGQSQRLYLLEVNPGANPKLTVTSTFSGGLIGGTRAKVSALCAQEKKETSGKVLGGVNGDFFDMSLGGTVGDMMRDGRWITAGEFPYGWAFAFLADGRAVIAQPRVSLTLDAQGTETKINALNQPRADQAARSTPSNVYAARQDNRLVLYTGDYAARAPAASGGIVVRFKTSGEVKSDETLQGVVAQVYGASDKGKAALGKGYMALSGIDAGAEALGALKPGDSIAIRCEANAEFAGAITVAGGGRPDGGPLLIREGRALDPPSAFADDYAAFYARNPRTVAGIRADGSFFFLLIEGNRAGSYGMTIAQTQQAALDLGAVSAVNLDGGPSSTMVVNKGRLTLVSNTTGTGGETRVGNALVLIENK